MKLRGSKIAGIVKKYPALLVLMPIFLFISYEIYRGNGRILIIPFNFVKRIEIAGFYYVSSIVTFIIDFSQSVIVFLYPILYLARIILAPFRIMYSWFQVRSTMCSENGGLIDCITKKNINIIHAGLLPFVGLDYCSEYVMDKCRRTRIVKMRKNIKDYIASSRTNESVVIKKNETTEIVIIEADIEEQDQPEEPEPNIVHPEEPIIVEEQPEEPIIVKEQPEQIIEENHVESTERKWFIKYDLFLKFEEYLNRLLKESEDLKKRSKKLTIE